MAFYNSSADSQTDTRAWIFVPAMEPLKDSENGVEILRLDADPVVLHREEPRGRLFSRREVDVRRLLATEFDGVSDEVLE